MFVNWLHHLFNPHCQACLAEREQARICQSCENLTMQLSFERAEKERLLNSILQSKEPVVINQIQSQPISVPKAVPWNVRRQMLEKEDRERARLMKDAPKPVSQQIDDLEKEILEENAEQSNSKS